MALNLKKSTTSATGIASQEDKADADVSSYKGNPLITLPINGRESTGRGKPFTFGLAKAKTILLYLEEVQEFIKAAEAGEYSDLEE